MRLKCFVFTTMRTTIVDEYQSMTSFVFAYKIVSNYNDTYLGLFTHALPMTRMSRVKYTISFQELSPSSAILRKQSLDRFCCLRVNNYRGTEMLVKRYIPGLCSLRAPSFDQRRRSARDNIDIAVGTASYTTAN